MRTLAPLLLALVACGSKDPPKEPAPAATQIPVASASPSVSASATASSSESSDAGATYPVGRESNRRLSGPEESLPETSPDLASVMARARPSFRRCYDTALASNPTLSGSFVVMFVVANDGTVSSAKANQQLGKLPPSVVDCVVAKVKSLRFSPHSGNPNDVNQPINFQPTP